MEKLDIVYLEPDLGSLFGAVALTAGGLKVLILESGRRSRDKSATDDGDVWSRFPAEPFMLRGVRTGGFLEPLLNRLGLLIKAREKVERIDPSYQVVTPQTRIEIRSEKTDMSRELAREFGPAYKGAIALFTRLEQMANDVYKLLANESFPAVPKKGGILRRTTGSDAGVEQLRSPTLFEVIAEQGLREPFPDFLRTAIAAYGGLSGPEAPAPAAAALFDSSRRGLFRADEDNLQRMLLTTFKARGGYTFPLHELENAEISGREIGALRASKSNYLKSKMFVGSATRWADYVPPELREAVLPAGSPSLHRLEVMMALEGLPVGMKERVVFLPENSNAVSPECVVKISVSRPLNVEGEARVVVAVESSRQSTADVRTELKEYLNCIIPFIDEYSRDERYTVETMPIDLDMKNLFLELPADGPIENLLPNEGELLHGMGLGENVISGRLLARVILRKLGLRAEI